MDILLLIQNSRLGRKLKAFLRQEGYSPVLVDSSSQALSHLISHSVDFIVLERENILLQKRKFLKSLQETAGQVPFLLLGKDEKEAFLYDDFVDVVPRNDRERLLYWFDFWKERRAVHPPQELHVTDEQLQRLSRIMEVKFAHKLEQGSRKSWINALRERMKVLQFSQVSDYLRFLRYSKYREIEQIKFIQNITVSETSFYRTGSHFQLLQEKVIPEILDGPSSSPHLRIWSSGCSTGEEPYSLVICLEELKREKGWEFDYTIEATDLNYKYLERARQGYYNRRSIRNLTTDIVNRYFVYSQKKYQFRENYRQRVEFKYFNLNSQEKYFRPERWEEFDIIFCENVLIYFPLRKVEEIVGKFYRLLKNQGFLFLGYSESLLKVDHSFASLSQDNAFYYQKNPPPEKVEVEKEKTKSPSSPRPPASTSRDSSRLMRWRGKGSPAKNFSRFWKEMIDRGLFKQTPPDIIDTDSGSSNSQLVIHEGESQEIFDREIFGKEVFEKLVEAEEYLGRRELGLAKAIYESLASGKGCSQELIEVTMEFLRQGREEMVEFFVETFDQMEIQTPEAHYLKGLYYQAQNKFEDSKREFEKAVYLNPDYIPGHFQLGEIFASQGNKLRAQASFANILELLPQNSDIRLATLEGVLRTSELWKICKNNLETLKGNT